MRYFVQGLRVDLRETVLLKQPKTFREAVEMAHLASAVKTAMSNSNETVATQLNNLTNTLNTLVTSSNSPTSNKWTTVTSSPDRNINTKSEPQVDFQSKIEEFIKRVDAGITGLAQRRRETRNNREIERWLTLLSCLWSAWSLPEKLSTTEHPRTTKQIIPR